MREDVLIVHAAGNDGKDIDSNENFPNDSDDKKQNMQTIQYWCFEFDYGDKVVAGFSNIGKVNDVLHLA
jgi:hypothetical protein